MTNKQKFRFIVRRRPLLLIAKVGFLVVAYVGVGSLHHAVASESSVGDEGVAATEIGSICGQPAWDCPSRNNEQVSCAAVMPKAKSYDSMDSLAADKAKFLHKGKCRCGDNGIVCKAGDVPLDSD